MAYSQALALSPRREPTTRDGPVADARRPHIRRSHLRAPQDEAATARAAFGDMLTRLAARAKARNCAIEKLLHDEPLLTETAFYRQLAAYLGVSFLAFPVPLDPTINPHEALAVGLAPSHRREAPDDTPTFVYAPQGARLASLAEEAHAHLIMPGAQIAIMTPTTFRMSVRATFGKTIAHSATAYLPRIARIATACSISHKVWISLLAGLSVLLLLSALWSNMPWHFSLLLATCFPILPGFVIKLMALHNTKRDAKRVADLADADLPTYTVLVPVYREAAILPQLMASLCALDYPSAKLDIKMLIESDDTETLTALESVTLPAGCDVVICPHGMPRTKPRALSIGLAYARSELIVVYDAEDMPEPDQLKKAAAIFAASDTRLACLQARLAIDNREDSWLTRQFTLEYAALFDVLLPGLAALNQPIPLGGTSNHFRRAAVQAVGAWDPWNVTEDADLGMRLFRAGYRVETFNSTTYEEAPATYKAWTNQRTRWLKGWMQTAIVHIRSHGKDRDPTTHANWIMLILAASISPVSILFHPSLLFAIDLAIDLANGAQKSGVLDILLDGCFLAMFCASAMFDMMIVARGAVERRIALTLGQLLSLIPYSLLKTIAAWRALFELLYAPYLWRKTDHGLARTSERRKTRRI